MRSVSNSLLFVAILVMVFAGFEACSSDDEGAITTGSITLQVTNLIGGQPLEVGSTRYTNENGDEFDVSEFKFFISNIKLRNNTSGELFVAPDSYHLVEATATSHMFEFTIADVPAGSYDQIELAIGVDNGSNTSIDQLGDLDPTSNMAWNWNTGYKFLLIEGQYYPAGADAAPMVYHIGSDPNYRKLTYPASLTVAAGGTNTVNFTTEVQNIFRSPNTIAFNADGPVKGGDVATAVAENYGTDFLTLTNAQ